MLFVFKLLMIHATNVTFIFIFIQPLAFVKFYKNINIFGKRWKLLLFFDYLNETVAIKHVVIFIYVMAMVVIYAGLY